MVYPITLEIAADKDATTWTDLTSAVRVESIRMGGQASGGGGSGFGFDFEDPAAAFTLPARRVVRLVLANPGGFLVAQGRVTDKGLKRMSSPVGDARQFNVNLNDGNGHLQGIPVHRWVRPAETDVERITALCADFLAGDPRPSTNLATTYLSSSNPIPLDAFTYDASNPAGVLAHVRGISGKLGFVTLDDELYYDAIDSVAYAGDLVITDAIDADPLAFEFNPIWSGTPGVQDGTEFYSGLYVSHGDAAETEYWNNPTAESAHDYWEEVVYSGTADDDFQATYQVEALVAERSVEEERFTFAVELADTQIGLIKYGQTFSFRAAAAGVTSPRVLRASRVTWSNIAPGRWRGEIEAGFPKKVAPRLTRGGAPLNPSVPNSGGSTSTVCAGFGSFLPNWLFADAPSAVEPLPYYAVGSYIRIGPGEGTVSGSHPGLFAWAESGKAALAPGTPDFEVTDFPPGVGDVTMSGRLVVPPGDGDLIIGFVIGYDVLGSATTFGFTWSADGVSPDDLFGASPTVEFGQSYFFRIKLTQSGGRSVKTWRVLDTEPDYDAVAGSGLTAINRVAVSVQYDTPMGEDDPPGEVVIDQLVWCYEVTPSTAYVGASYGPVFVAHADGATSTFTLPGYPGTGYVPGSLSVYVDGIWQAATETDPAAGEFELGWEPAEDDVVTASWRVPS